MNDYLNQIWSDLTNYSNGYFNGDFNSFAQSLNQADQLEKVFGDLKQIGAKSVADITDVNAFRNKLLNRADDKDNSRLAQLSPDYVNSLKEKEKAQEEQKVKKPTRPQIHQFSPVQDLLKYNTEELSDLLDKKYNPIFGEVRGLLYYDYNNALNRGDTTVAKELKIAAKHVYLLNQMDSFL